jgi:trehalose-phosphatase
MNHLLRQWSEVAPRLREAESIALFLDFDGTLAPFAPKPAAARLPWATRRVLQRLGQVPKLRIWVVSARRHDDLRARIEVPGVRCRGLYGWENGQPPPISEADRRLLERARIALAVRLAGIEGVWLENKEATVAMHWRGAPRESVHQAAQVCGSVLEPFHSKLRTIEGDHVWEVAPRGLPGKGAAARELWHTWRSHALPVYVGDNAADEPAFAALAAGITVRVGPARNTRAGFVLYGTGEVRRFLEKLEVEVR